MDLFTPGNYSVVRPNQARQIKGDSTPTAKPAKPNIPVAQPVNRKSPRKKMVKKDNAAVKQSDVDAQKGGKQGLDRGIPNAGFHNETSELNLGNLDSEHIMYHSINQTSDIHGHGASLPLMNTDTTLHHNAAAFPQTVAYGFPADSYFQSVPMMDMTIPYAGTNATLSSSTPTFPHMNVPLQDGAYGLKQSNQEIENERVRLDRQEKDVEDIKKMVEFIKNESTKVAFDPEVHISIKDMNAKIKEIVKDKDSAFEVYKSRTIASTEAMVKDHIEKQTAAHTKEMELEAANETLKETVSQLDTECHRLEGEVEALKEEGKERKVEMEKISGAKLTVEEALIDAENRYGKMESENEILATNLKKCNADLTHARQEAVVSAFKLKKVMESHKLQLDQIERLKGKVEDQTRELAASKANYDEIVTWAKSTEESHRKHDDEVHDAMNKQHEKFNVEYEFLGKQNKVLKEEVRSVNHELKDAKALLEHAMEQMKDLHRESNASRAAEKRMKKKSEELQALVDENDHATEDLVRKFNLAKERDIEALNYSHDRDIAKLNKIILAKDSTEKELTAKLEFVRKKVKDMEADIKNRDRRIVLLEEQVLFETKMREINLQKRAETENGGLEAIVQLLKINEENKKSLDALSQSNISNLNTVRGDIEALMKKAFPEPSSNDSPKKKKKKAAVAAKAKLKSTAMMIGKLGAVREMEQGMADIDADMERGEEIADAPAPRKSQVLRAKPDLATFHVKNMSAEEKISEETLGDAREEAKSETMSRNQVKSDGNSEGELKEALLPAFNGSITANRVSELEVSEHVKKASQEDLMSESLKKSEAADQNGVLDEGSLPANPAANVTKMDNNGLSNTRIES